MNRSTLLAWADLDVTITKGHSEKIELRKKLWSRDKVGESK